MSIQKFIISKDDSIYEAWPDVVQTVSGKLICVFMECAHHLDREDARITLAESTNRGRTWSEKRYLTKKCTKEAFFNCARISRMKDGSLVVICDFIRGDENGSAENAVEQWLWHGDSEGTVWSEPVVLPFRGIVPDKFRVLENGRCIIAAHYKNHATGLLEQYLWYSDDKGKTWSDRVTMAADPRYNLCEVSILECGGGILVGFLRENSLKGYPVLKTISRDYGETWSPVYETPIDCGHRPVSGFLQDGRVFVTYRYIPVWMNSMLAAVLDGKELLCTEPREQHVRILQLDYDRNPSPDLGYTGWTQFDDGEIYVVNYIKDDSDKAHIRGYSLYPEDIVLPTTDASRSDLAFWNRG